MIRLLILMLVVASACSRPAEEPDAMPEEDPYAEAIPPAEEDPAVQEANDIAELERRRASMESRESCLRKAAAAPDHARGRLEEACNRLPAARP